MANDKGAQRLTAILFSTFGDFAVDRPMRALRCHPCPSLGTLPRPDASARTIHLKGGLAIYGKLVLNERNLTGRSSFASRGSLIKIFY